MVNFQRSLIRSGKGKLGSLVIAPEVKKMIQIDTLDSWHIHHSLSTIVFKKLIEKKAQTQYTIDKRKLNHCLPRVYCMGALLTHWRRFYSAIIEARAGTAFETN